MKITTFEIRGDKLRQMPIEEQLLFVQLSHIGNAISILQKLLLYTSKTSSDEIIRKGFVAQGSLVARMLGGVLHEGWQVLSSSFFASQLSKKYERELSQEGLKALEALKKYFGRRNTITTLRNKFAFHCDSDAVREYIEQVDTDNIYHLYLAPTQMNSLFYMAEEIAGMSMINTLADLTQADTVEEVHRQLYEDILYVSRWFLHFSHECVASIAREHFGTDGEFPVKDVEIEDGPAMSDIVVPYFVSPPARSDA